MTGARQTRVMFCQKFFGKRNGFLGKKFLDSQNNFSKKSGKVLIIPGENRKKSEKTS